MHIIHYLQSFVMWLQNNQLILARWPHLFALSLFFFAYLNHILSWADDKLNINWKFYMHCSFLSGRINHSGDCFSAFSSAERTNQAVEMSSCVNILYSNWRNPWCNSREKSRSRLCHEKRKTCGEENQKPSWSLGAFCLFAWATRD